MGRRSDTSPLMELLGDVPYPTFAPNVDFRDATDAVVSAIHEAFEKSPDRFFDVLDRQPALLESHEVVCALGSIEDARAVPHLLGVLRDGDATMRWSAAHGVEKRKDPRVVDGLIAALRDRARRSARWPSKPSENCVIHARSSPSAKPRTNRRTRETRTSRSSSTRRSPPPEALKRAPSKLTARAAFVLLSVSVKSRCPEPGRAREEGRLDHEKVRGG